MHLPPGANATDMPYPVLQDRRHVNRRVLHTYLYLYIY
jgi:hypothetical protein